jgi:hypothetical protein
MNLSSAIVTFEQLKAATGYDSASGVERCLRKNGVRFLYGKLGIYTTVDAINAAMGLKLDNPNPNQQDIDIL